MFPREASKRLGAGGCLLRLNEATAGVSRPMQISFSDKDSSVPETEAPNASLLNYSGRRSCSVARVGTLRLFNGPPLKRCRGFTLLELLIVVGIIAVLLVLLAPAFTNLKNAGDVTSAAYTIKGVLDTARTYAKANNTYTWVGFYEEDVSQSSTNPATSGIGRIVMSTVASKDGTIAYDPMNVAQQNLTSRVTQVGKLIKIDNMHLWTHTDVPSEMGLTFDTRPNIASIFCIGDVSPPNSTTLFQYPVGNPPPAAQYTFVKTVQFSPRGEARINNSTVNANGTEIFPLQTAAEIALEPTHGANLATSIPANAVAVQFTGIAGNITIYRR
jgi:prepilin-type N-terminal cleavage/methylation domain-containing protein